MKTNFVFTWFGILFFALALASCSTDDAAFYIRSTNITAFTFDSVRDGYGEKVKYTDHRFTIDLRSDEDTALVYNVDSLPYRSDVSRMLLTITSAADVYRKTGEETYELFASRQDTLNYTEPIIFVAVGVNENGYLIEKTYKLTLNIHQVNPDTVVWEAIDPNISLPGKYKSLIYNSQLYLFGENGKIYSSPLSDATQWRQISTSLPFDYASPQVFAGRMYLTAAGKVYISEDGTHWEVQESLSAGEDMETLLGATNQYLSGIKNGRFCSTQGTTWEIGGTASHFQRTYPSSVTYGLSSNSYIQQVAILGVASGEATGHTLLVAEDNLLNWSNWGPVDSTTYQLPVHERMALIRYRGNLFYSFGGSSSTAFKNYYTSSGLYWTEHTNHTFFPDSFYDRGDFTAVVDSENYIWLIFSDCTKGKAVIYKGRFSSYSF